MNIHLLYNILNTSSGTMFFSSSFNIIEELNYIYDERISNKTTEEGISKLLALVPSFPCLKYVSLTRK